MNNDPSRQEIAINTQIDLNEIRPGRITIVRGPLPIRVSATSNEDSLILNLEPTDRNERSILLTFPNSELAIVVNHLLSLVSSPTKKRSLSVKATGPAVHFNAFWSLYPGDRKVAKHQMLSKWQGWNLDKEWDAIRRHLQLNIPKWAKDNFTYCPLVTTYVNQRRWEAIMESQQPDIPMV